MRPISRPESVPAVPAEPPIAPPWQRDIAQLLEEHHIAAWATLPVVRNQFADALAEHLGGLADSKVCVIYGPQVTDLPTFCNALERAIGFDRIQRRIDGPDGVVGALRRRMTAPGAKPIKHRYYLWRDADVLLRADHALFGRLVDAMIGVAAESEFASEDLLLIQRTVFVGGPALDVYAEDGRGQFRTWWSEHGEDPLWRIVSGQDEPRVISYRIGDEVQAAPAPRVQVRVGQGRALRRA